MNELRAQKLYQKEARAIPLLTREKEVELAHELTTARHCLARATRRLPAVCKRQTLIIEERPWLCSGTEWSYEAVAHFSRSLERWLRDKRFKDLTPAERSCRRHMRQLMNARDTLITSNLRLVGSTARYFSWAPVPQEDLVGEGNIALFDAVWRFNPVIGKFSTYAIWWIRQRMYRTMSDQGMTVRIPQYAQKILRPIREAYKALTQELGRRPTPNEVATYLSALEGFRKGNDVTSRQLQFDVQIIEIDAPFGEDDSGNEFSLADQLHEEDEHLLTDYEKRELQEVIQRYRRELDPKEDFILMHRFGLDGHSEKTLKEIGELMNLSRERVRQLEYQAKERVRKIHGRRGDLKVFL